MSAPWLWFGGDDADADVVDPPSMTFEVVENPVVGVLYGPDGDVLAVQHERPRVPFGFTR